MADDITDLAPKDCKHGVPDDVHCDACAYEWEKSSIKTIAQQAERIERLTARMTLFENALGHIRWVKDCGIDSIDDDGLLHNYPAEERDLMYEIAGKALRGEPCCADGKPESASRAALAATAAPPSREDLFDRHTKAVEAWMQELAPYLGLDGDGPYKPVDFIEAANREREWAAEKMAEVAALRSRAIHESAPEGCRCADCTMDKEACPTCYATWWKRQHPNVIQIESSREVQLQAVVDELVACKDLREAIETLVQQAQSWSEGQRMQYGEMKTHYERRKPVARQAARRLRSAEGTKG